MVNAIYDAGNYVEEFERDLIEAEKTIIISSPDICTPKIERFLYIIRPRQEDGVRITVITTDPENVINGSSLEAYDLVQKMRDAGIDVIMKQDADEHFAVLDDRIVWHGGMNLLGKEDVWDNLMRVSDPDIAAELLELGFRTATVDGNA